MDHSYQDVYWRSGDGLRLHARDYPGDARRLPVVCIPGLTRNAADFELLAPWLAAKGHRVLAVDLRGRAGSERDPRPSRYSAGRYAKDMLELLRDRQIDRAVFIGTSLGAMVTMLVACRRSKAVAAAVLNDAGPEVGRAALARIRAYAGKPVPPMALAETAAYAQRVAAVAFPRYTDSDWRAMAARMFRQRDDGLYEPDYDPAIVRTASPLLLQLTRPVLWCAFRRLARHRPTLLLRGALSDVLEPELAARMARAAPTMRLVEVPDVGHAPDLSEPAARAAIEALLAEAS